MMSFFRKDKYRLLTIKIIYKILPMVLFVAYPVLIVYAFFNLRSELLKIIFVPFGVFVFVTVLRKIINEQRPYEKHGISSLFGKTTKGQSMPSRHTASAFVIAMTFLYVDFNFGITALCIAMLIALSRIFAGVHFIRDVLVGAGISILSGFIFLFLL